ncbi:hypothetical protein PsorP6_019252 [Peronosclerospora sorghi]|nr:hypothetical protein PsorP6_019252 [Peronosclerospora sorghi]
MKKIQRTLAESHASQCGYCTPGFIMALYTMVKEREMGEELLMEDIEHGLDGNLCHCTGYRPILDAEKSFGDDAQEEYCKGTCPGCPHTGKETGDIEDLHGDKCKEVTSCSSHKIRELVKKRKQREKEMMSESDPWMAEWSFPKELIEMEISPEVVHIDGKHVHWFAPLTMTHVLELKRQYPDAKISVGNSEMAIETKFKGFRYAHLVNVSRIPEFKATRAVAPADHINQTLFAVVKPFKDVKIGTALTLTQVKQQLSERIKKLSPHQTRAFESIIKMLKWFASTHIRNVAFIAGNLVTASRISDLNPLLAVMNAFVELRSTRGTRYCKVREFFASYCKVIMEPDEVITSVYVPYTTEWEYILPFKQARRREDDISIVTAGIRIPLEYSRETKGWKIQNASTVFGGMAAMTMAASKTEESLRGNSFDASTFDKSCDILTRKISSSPMEYQVVWPNTDRLCAHHFCTSSFSRLPRVFSSIYRTS